MGWWSEFEVTEEALVFVETRRMSAQWDVSIEGTRHSTVARVTERYVADPTYSVVLIGPDCDEVEKFTSDRDEVIKMILEHVNQDFKFMRCDRCLVTYKSTTPHKCVDLVVADSKLAIAGKADCGCVYHAEDGIPCPHDIELAKKSVSQKE